MNHTAIKSYRLSRPRMYQGLIDFSWGALCGVLLAIYFFLGV